MVVVREKEIKIYQGCLLTDGKQKFYPLLRKHTNPLFQDCAQDVKKERRGYQKR